MVYSRGVQTAFSPATCSRLVACLRAGHSPEGFLRPVGRRLMAAAVLLVVELLSVYTVTLLADASHKESLWIPTKTELSPDKLAIWVVRV